VLYRLIPIDELLIRAFGRAGKVLSIVLFFHLVCLGWIFFRATPDQFWPIMNSIIALPTAATDTWANFAQYWTPLLQGHGLTGLPSLIAGTLQGFVSLNWTFSVYAWGLIAFAIPVWLTDYLGWRRDVEFPDLFGRFSWPIAAVIVVALLYGIIFFARRQANEFIYFAF
jgi:hypothetical protein